MEPTRLRSTTLVIPAPQLMIQVSGLKATSVNMSLVPSACMSRHDASSQIPATPNTVLPEAVCLLSLEVSVIQAEDVDH